MKYIVRKNYVGRNYLIGWAIVAMGVLGGCAQGPASGAALSEPKNSTEAPFVPGEVIVKLKPGFGAQFRTQSVGLERLRALPLENVSLYRVTPSLRAQSVSRTDTLALVARLSARDDVLYAHPNYVLNTYTLKNSALKNYALKAAAVPDDPLYGLQWHYRAINLPAAWDQTTGSAEVAVAVIDSGVVVTHPDLASKLSPGYDFVSSAANSGDGDGRDNDPTDPVGNSHGSHVAGIVAASSNNGVGVAGVSWDSRILPVRVLGTDGGTLADIIDGILWSAGQSVPGIEANSNPAQVLNLSLGGSFRCSDVPALQSAFDRVNAAGAVVVVAAGNDNTAAASYSPASCNGVITVGAATLTTSRAYYSNYGSRVDVTAPGGDMRRDIDSDGNLDGVLSTVQGGYAYFQGTSMAAPQVAGVVALMKSVQPSLTYSRALDILKRTAQPIVDSSCSVGCGAGLIDAAAALQLAGATPVPATYTVNFSAPVPIGRVTAVSLGRGITSLVGTNKAVLGITARRTDKNGNVAVVAGSARHFVISKDGKSQTSYAKGGKLNFELSNFGGGTVKTLKVRDTTTTGGTVTVYSEDKLLKRIRVPKTGSGATKTLTLNVANATRVTVMLTGPGAVDDLVFTAPS